jgi:hypothetical protein
MGRIRTITPEFFASDAARQPRIGGAHGPDERRGGYRKSAAATDSVAADSVSETQWRARLSKSRPGRFWLEGA